MADASVRLKQGRFPSFEALKFEKGTKSPKPDYQQLFRILTGDEANRKFVDDLAGERLDDNNSLWPSK